MVGMLKRNILTHSLDLVKDIRMCPQAKTADSPECQFPFQIVQMHCFGPGVSLSWTPVLESYQPNYRL